MTHRVLGCLLAVAGCCLLAACANTAPSGEAEETPVAKPENKEGSAPAATLAERTPGDYGGIRPPKDLLSLPKDHELKATNPAAGERPPAGGVIVNPAGPPPER
jgi:hypothetical protein